MSAELKPQLRLEIGHVLFIDLVGYSKLLIEEQKKRLRQLTEIVLATAQVREASNEQLVRLPTGDGMALVFRNSAEEPARCALEIAQALKKHPEIPTRMGVHSGPVSDVTDLNSRTNIAGAGINMAQRVMDFGDAGHILLSRHVAEDLEQYGHWQPQLHDLGECEVKHGVRLGLVNLYTHGVGNPRVPKKIRALRQRKRIRWFAAAAVLLLLAAGAVTFLMFMRKPTQSAAAVTGKSIAVLPFANLSSDKENAYFADGIQDEILTRLSKIAALKVISRTSSQKYKSAPDNLREIGNQLGVANLLEGSVQKVANTVHINVQLIRAATDEHVWAESYNRKLDDVFAVEGEVASAIAEQLDAKLSGTEQKAITDKPTQNTAAYDAYLRGLSLEHSEYSYAAYQKVALGYAEAVQLDPKFALAWARLAAIRSFLYFNAIDLKTNTPAAVKEAADRATALAPETGESWIAQGAYRYRVLRDFPGALQAYDEARKRLPNSSLVFEYMGYVNRRLGRWAEAEANYKKASELDPRDVQLLNSMGSEFYNLLRRFDAAHAALDRALEISPDSAATHANKASVLQAEGRLAEAAQELAPLPADSVDDWVVTARVSQGLYEHQFDAAIKIVERKVNALPPGQPLDSETKLALVLLGYAQEWASRGDDARRTFTRAIHEISPTPDVVVPPDANGTPVTLALAYAGLRDKEKALAQAQRAVADYNNDALARPSAEVALAQIQARFGDLDPAIAALPHLLEVPAGITPADLRFNPLWDPLRKDPRFQKLCEGKQP